MKLWLDDERPAPEGWTWVKTVTDCLFHLLQFEVTDLSLDNDLGLPGLFNEGREVVKRLVEWQEIEGRDHWPKSTISIHSWDVTARPYMEGMLSRYSPFSYDRASGCWNRQP